MLIAKMSGVVGVGLYQPLQPLFVISVWWVCNNKCNDFAFYMFISYDYTECGTHMHVYYFFKPMHTQHVKAILKFDIKKAILKFEGLCFSF